MTKKEVFKILHCRCSPTKRYLFKVLRVFYRASQIELNEDQGYYKVSLNLLVGQTDYLLNIFGNVCREFAVYDEIDNGFVKLYYINRDE